MGSLLKNHGKKIGLAVAGLGLIIGGQTEAGWELLQSAFGLFGFGG